MIHEEGYCQNPACGKPLAIISGHRRRQYCDDVCKQAAYRTRLLAARQAKEEAVRQTRIERERQELLKRYGNLLPETLDLLHSIRATIWVEQIVKTIRAEQEWVQQAQNQERNQLIEALLLTGEELGFPALVNDDFRLEQSVEHWLTFCEQADLGQLYQARDIVYIKVRAQTARKRLARLSPHT